MKLIISIIFLFFLFVNVFSQADTSFKSVKYYYTNGNISSSGFLFQGKPDGYWKSYYENGKIKSEGNRVNFKLDGAWLFYDENGNLRTLINYENGLKNGYRYTYLENESIEDYFENDIKQKESKIFFEDGKIKKITPYLNGLENGYVLTFDHDSVIILIENYRNGLLLSSEVINRKSPSGLKQGLWKYFYSNGFVQFEINYLNDKKHGYLKEYDKKGALIKIEKYINDILQTDVAELKEYEIRKDYYSNRKIKIEGSYFNNIPDGIRREYDTTGKIVKSYIFNKGIIVEEGIIDALGKKQGAWKTFYDNGKLQSIGQYKNSVKIGNWTYFYTNGVKEQNGAYTKTGKLTGDWIYYYNNGNIYKKESYIDGELDGEYAEYNDTGKVIVKGQYEEGFETGKWIYKIGDVIETGFYQDGLQSGLWTVEDIESGINTYKGRYFDGKPDGIHTYWYSNGKKRLEADYDLGIRNGDWKYYDEFGYLFLIITYQQGLEIKYNNISIK